MYKNLGLNEFNTIKDVEYAKQTLIDFGPECINFLYEVKKCQKKIIFLLGMLN